MDFHNTFDDIINLEPRVNEEQQKLKMLESYKATSMQLIKSKMDKADKIIRQYNDKIKECEVLNEELSSVRNDKLDIMSKYNLTLEKVNHLELSNNDYKQTVEKYKETTEEQKLKLDGNGQHINQLQFKIKELEGSNKELEEFKKEANSTIKKLENSKKATIKVEKKQQSKDTKSCAVNTDPVTFESEKPKTCDKSIMTDLSLEKQKQPFSFYCRKCEKSIPPPVDRILDIMTTTPENSLERLKSPVPQIPDKENYLLAESWAPETENDANIATNNSDNMFQPFEDDNKSIHSSFMDINKFKRKLKKVEKRHKKLEKKVKRLKHKKSKKQNSNCCYNKCCSKNVQFVVQLPNKEDYLKNQHRKKRDNKILNPLYPNCAKDNKKRNHIDKVTKRHEWEIESCLAPSKRKLPIEHDKEGKSKKIKMSKQDLINDLFNSQGGMPLSSNPPAIAENEDSSHSSDSELLSIPSPVQTSVKSANVNKMKNLSKTSQVPLTEKNSSKEQITEKIDDLPIKYTVPVNLQCIKKCNIQSKDIVFEENKKSADVAVAMPKSTEESANADKPLEKLERDQDLFKAGNHFENSHKKELGSKPTVSSNGAISLKLMHTESNSNYLSIKKLDDKEGIVSIEQLNDRESSQISQVNSSTSEILSHHENESTVFDNKELYGKETNSFEQLNACKSSQISQVHCSTNEISIRKENESTFLDDKELNDKDANSFKQLNVLESPQISQINNSTSEISFHSKNESSYLGNDQLNGKEANGFEQFNVIQPSRTSQINNLTSEISFPDKNEGSYLDNEKFNDKAALSFEQFNIIQSSQTSQINNLTSEISLPDKNEGSYLENEKFNDKVALSFDQSNVCESSIISQVNNSTVDISNLSEEQEDVEKSCKTNIPRRGRKKLVKSENNSHNSHKRKLRSHQSISSDDLSLSKSFDNKIDNMDLEDKESKSKQTDQVNLIKSSPISQITNSTLDQESKFFSIKDELKIESNKDDSDPNNGTMMGSESRPAISYKGSCKPNRNFIIDDTTSSLPDSKILTIFNEHLNVKKESIASKRNKTHFGMQEKTAKYIDEQLYFIMEAEEWTNEINSQACENLVKLGDFETVAFVMIEHAADKISEEEGIDKTFTPPAPMMTRSEQKLITLILHINRNHQGFSDIIIQGIEHKLFRLGSPLPVHTIERLFRMILVLCKINKDREKVRIFICDALYSLTMRAVDIIYIAVTCWPEILPKYDSNNDIMVKTIIHLIMTQHCTTPYTRLSTLRKHLSQYYGYPNSGYLDSNFKQELMNKIRENEPCVKSCVILLCKRKGPKWTYDNVVIELKQMIVQGAHQIPPETMFEMLTLLGDVLRTFPNGKKENYVNTVIKELCGVLESGFLGNTFNEGLFSCLLSLGKFGYEDVAKAVIQWKPTEDLRSTSKIKLLAFIKMHDEKWWKSFVKKNFPPVTKEN